MKSQLEKAIQLRKENKPEQALVVLGELLKTYPNHPDLNYQMAWTYDFMGKESDAVRYYEKAISNGLVEDRSGAMLGLGSTYRCLGECEKSLKVFDQAVSEFPTDRALKVFRALTLYNLGKSEESVSQLLIQIIDTTSDAQIKFYEKALRFYSDKLNEIWK